MERKDLVDVILDEFGSLKDVSCLISTHAKRKIGRREQDFINSLNPLQKVLYDEIIYSLLDLDGGTQRRLVRYTLDYVISLLENPLKPTIY